MSFTEGNEGNKEKSNKLMLWAVIGASALNGRVQVRGFRSAPIGGPLRYLL